MQVNLQGDSEWIAVNDETRVRTILRAYGDVDKKNIMINLVNKPDITSNVLRKCDIPQTSGYRKIKELIDDDLIVTKRSIVIDGRRFYKYISVFEDLDILIAKNNVVIKVKMNKEVRNMQLKNKMNLSLDEQITN
ncbi:MAG: hypothetical protein HY222_04305 [Thaumarchaeota archaeon]|nr:hypothetical protein [Nitrososphaerota archaeon]MBI3641597.1 hypothetical protein [Nitrososphaerota archaeon]